MWLTEPHVREKEKERTTLPQANRAVHSDNAWFACPPRNSCYSTFIGRIFIASVSSRREPCSRTLCPDYLHKLHQVVVQDLLPQVIA